MNWWVFVVARCACTLGQCVCVFRYGKEMEREERNGRLREEKEQVGVS